VLELGRDLDLALETLAAEGGGQLGCRTLMAILRSCLTSTAR